MPFFLMLFIMIGNIPFPPFKITPAYPKFAEKLGHRDILGSLMQLGIDRCKLGDILVGEQEAYLLCEETVADYFAEHLEKDTPHPRESRAVQPV